MGKRVLLVEGKNDQHVMWNLFEVRGIRDVFQVVSPKTDRQADENGGIDKLLEVLPRWLLEPDLERLAVIVDADDKGPKRRWEQIRDRLRNRGYDSVPQGFPENGVFELSLGPQTQRSVCFAVWVMPDNRSEGMLEDFVAKLVPEDDEIRPIVDRFLDSILDDKRIEDERRFKPRHRAKAWVHSWLAVQKEPGKPMGQAIGTKKYFDANKEVVQPFLDWITNALVN